MPYSQAEIIKWAEKKIEEARRSGETDLYLGGLNLARLPKTIGRLSSLQLLGLYFNELTEIPEEVGQLSQLKTLILANNRIADLPRSLAGLARLEMLNLDGNPLNPKLAAAYRHGIEAVKAYLRAK